MKIMLILYAFVGIIFQIIIGKWTGFGQGSIGILTFVFLIEIDPRFKFAYILPNIKAKQETKNGESK